MEKVVRLRAHGGLKTHFEDDDFIDRLNSRWTIRALFFCVFVVSTNIFFHKQIYCWTPTEFNGHHHEYTNSICWLKGSYYLPTEEIKIPGPSTPRTYFISYYQWTPFILLVMALLFLLPRFIWHSFPQHGGVNIRRLVKGIRSNTDDGKGLEIAKRTLKLYLDVQSDFQGTVGYISACRRLYCGHTLAYFGIKFLYVMNTISQFFLLNAFLSFHFHNYGFEIFKKISQGEDWFESPRFPRVTMCDFMVRRLGSNQHWYSVQCNLPFNMYNEKIFLGVWIWLIILTILNILSIISWIISLTKAHRLSSIKKYLTISRSIPMERESLLSSVTITSDTKEKDTDERLNSFINYLHLDGYLFFRLIARNTDEIVAGKIMKYLYTNYKRPSENFDSNV